jgi:phosphoribosylformimino-5-aminoimidazole carboxamide ribotide isomerase
VSTLDDISALATIPGLGGVIVGRAIYEGHFTVAEAVAVLERSS